jgi:hypothetical protein
LLYLQFTSLTLGNTGGSFHSFIKLVKSLQKMSIPRTLWNPDHILCHVNCREMAVSWWIWDLVWHVFSNWNGLTGEYIVLIIAYWICLKMVMKIIIANYGIPVLINKPTKVGSTPREWFKNCMHVWCCILSPSVASSQDLKA